jgi:TP901 family phage tail tape measure protein
MPSLGDLVVNLRSNTTQFDRAMVRAEGKLSKFSASSMKMARDASMAGAAALAAGAAYSIKALINFDDAIRATAAVSKASAGELAALEQNALQLGKTTSFTASEVANLMTELGRAGFKPDAINDMTGAVLNMARATGTDAAQSAGIMAATIRQFGLEATDAAHVADVFTETANSTFNTVEQLGESMSYAGPVAKQLGMSLEDTAAILGTLGNVGIQGSNAGTAIRRLGTITAAEAEKMKGVFNFDFTDMAGNARPLIDIMGDIGNAVDNMPTGQKMAKLNKAFGILGITAAGALADGAGDAAALAERLKEIGPAAAETAAKMDAGIGGSFRKMTSALDGLAISFGQKLEPGFIMFTEWMQSASAWVDTGLTPMIDGIGDFAATLFVMADNIGDVFLTVVKFIADIHGELFKFLLQGFKRIADEAKNYVQAGLKAAVTGRLNVKKSTVAAPKFNMPEMKGVNGLDTKIQDTLSELKRMREEERKAPPEAPPAPEIPPVQFDAAAAAKALGEGFMKMAQAPQVLDTVAAVEKTIPPEVDQAEPVVQADPQFASVMQQGSEEAFTAIFKAMQQGKTPEEKAIVKVEAAVNKGNVAAQQLVNIFTGGLFQGIVQEAI